MGTSQNLIRLGSAIARGLCSQGLPLASSTKAKDTVPKPDTVTIFTIGLTLSLTLALFGL